MSVPQYQEFINRGTGVFNRATGYRNETPIQSNQNALVNGGQTAQAQPDYETALKTTQEPSKWDYLRELSAKDLLDANVMTNISNEVAKKNLQAQLASQGLANSGYASSAMALQGNAYANQMNQNLSAYQQAIAQHDLKEMEYNEQAQALRADTLANNLSAMDDVSRMENYLKSKGFTKTDKGWEKEGYTADQLSEINDAYASAIYQSTGEDINDSSKADITDGKTGVSDIKQATPQGKDYYSTFKDEYDWIEAGVKNGKYKNNTAFHVERGHFGEGEGPKGGDYLLYKNGKYYIITKREYDTFAGAKAFIKDGKEQGN